MLRVSLTCALALLTGSLVAEAIATGEEAVAWEATQPVVVDGSLDEWVTASPIMLSEPTQVIINPHMWVGQADLSAVVYVMWDVENLYIGATVTDDSPLMYRMGFPPDQADSISIYISTDPSADPARDAYAPTDFRVVLVADGYDYPTGVDRSMVADPKGILSAGMEYGDEQVLVGYEAALTEADGGYIFEAKIPWRNFASDEISLLVPAAGMVVAFNVVVNDLDMPCPGIDTKTIAWKGSSLIRSNPREWGQLRFSAAKEE